MLASRLLSILMLLQTRGRVSARELAEEFEVAVRTIHRDIDELSAAGVPVYAERGRNGGFRLADGYRTKLTGLNQSEAETLFLAGLPGPAADLGFADALATARLKLLAALPPTLQPSAERIASRFLLDPGIWFQNVAPLPSLPVHRCTTSGRDCAPSPRATTSPPDASTRSRSTGSTSSSTTATTLLACGCSATSWTASARASTPAASSASRPGSG